MWGVYRGGYLGSCSWSLAEVGMEIRYSDFLPYIAVSGSTDFSTDRYSSGKKKNVRIGKKGTINEKHLDEEPKE